MRKSSIEQKFDHKRLQCETDFDLVIERQLCDAMNCPCARDIMAEWTSDAFDEYFRNTPTYFCTIYLKRDALLWSKIGLLKIRNIKNRLKRLLRRAGLDKAIILGVLDAILVAKTGFTGNPEPKWHFHWHFFMKVSDLPPEKMRVLRSLLKSLDSGLRPFVAKLITTEGFYTPYLWKPSTKLRRRVMRPGGVIYNFYTGHASGRYLGAMETFMIANPGLSWLYLQGLRRSSGRLIVQ